MPRTPPAKFLAPLQPDAALAAVIGSEPVSRPEITKRLWLYIKSNGRQDAVNRRQLNADDTLRPFFDGADSVTMFQLPKLVSAHTSKVEG